MLELQEPAVKVRDERAVRAELARIQGAHPEGLLVPEDVVEAAKDEANPLHAEFNWNIEEAAHQHWLARARSLIRTIVVTMPDDGAESKLPKFVSLRSDRKKPGGGYRELGRVLKSPELLKELEDTAKKDLDAVLRRYDMLKAFCERVRKAAKIPVRNKGKSKK